MVRKNANNLGTQIRKVEKLLPLIEKSLLQLQIWQGALEILDETEMEIDEETDEVITAITKFNKDYHFMCFTFYKTLDNLQKIGCIVRDLDDGLVDIRVNIAGKDINLSWKLGEKKIEYWHDPQANPEVRNKILSLPEVIFASPKKVDLKKK